MKLFCCDYCTQRANLSPWNIRINSEILTKVTDLQGIISTMWSHPVLLTQKITKGVAQTKLVKHTVDHLLEGWWSQLAGDNEQWQGVSSPLRSPAPGTGGITTDYLSPTGIPSILQASYWKSAWYMLMWKEGRPGSLLLCSDGLGNEIKMITCWILTLVFLFSLSPHIHCLCFQDLCGIINTHRSIQNIKAKVPEILQLSSCRPGKKMGSSVTRRWKVTTLAFLRKIVRKKNWV